MKPEKLIGLRVPSLLQKQRELEKKRRLTTVDRETLASINEILASRQVAKSQDDPEKIEREAKAERLSAIRHKWEQPLNELLARVHTTHIPEPAQGVTFENYGDVCTFAGDLGLQSLAQTKERLRWTNNSQTIIENADDKKITYVVPVDTPEGVPTKGLAYTGSVNEKAKKGIAFLEVDATPMTPACAALELATATLITAMRNGAFSIGLGTTPGQQESSIDELQLKMGITLQGADILSGGLLKQVAANVREELHIDSFESLQTVAQNVKQWYEIIRKIMRTISRKLSPSKNDHTVQNAIAVFALLEKMPGMVSQTIIAQLEWHPTETLDEHDVEWGNIQKVLARLGVQDQTELTIAKHGGGISFLTRRGEVPEDSALLHYECKDYEDTLDLTVTLEKETDISANPDERVWIAGRLPTLDHLILDTYRREFETECDRIEKRAEHVDLSDEEKSLLAIRLAQMRAFRWQTSDAVQPDASGDTVVLGLPGGDGTIPFEYKNENGENRIIIGHEPWSAAWRAKYMLRYLPFFCLRSLETDDPGTFEDSQTHKLQIEQMLQIERMIYPVAQPKFDRGGETLDMSEAVLLQHLKNIIAATRGVTRHLPQCIPEAWLRTEAALYPYEDLTLEELQTLANTLVNDYFMTLMPIREDPAHHEKLSNLLDIILDEAPQHMTFASRRDSLLFVCRKEHLPQNLQQYASPDTEETLDLVVNLNLQDEDALETDAWVSGTLPTIQELEREFFDTNVITERFLPNRNAKGDDTEENITIPEGAEVTPEALPIPRLRAVRDTLLRLKVKATFTLDERLSMPQSNQYGLAEPGHYVVVTIPDANIQLLVSDDRSKGTRVIYNHQIDPTYYATIDAQELDRQLGPTRLRFSDRVQFMDVLASTLKQRIENPYPVYPVNSRHPSPLDNFPNDEAIVAIRRDFEMAAQRAGKQNALATLVMSDIGSIPSEGGFPWSFGGAAGGSAYLDRMATEFGLDASRLTMPENPVEQYEYRERVFRLLMWALNMEGYQEEREKLYAQSDSFGHFSNIRKSRKRRKLNQ